MGRHYVNKLLLFDEQELAPTSAAATFQDLEAAVRAECNAEFSIDDNFPEYEFLGVASERFDRGNIHDGNYSEPVWLRDEGWEATLVRVFEWTVRGLMQFDSTTNKQEALEEKIRDAILQHISATRYEEAGNLCHVLAGLQKSGLPGFRDSYHMTSGGEDDLLDYRRQNYGPGQRILVEIAFVWD